MNKHGSLNRAYRIIWSYAKQCLVVVSELAKSNGKSSGERSISPVVLAESLQPYSSTYPPPLIGFKLKKSKYPFSLMGGLSLMTTAMSVSVPTGVYGVTCSNGGATGCLNTASITALTNSGGFISADPGGSIASGSIIGGSQNGVFNTGTIGTLSSSGTISGGYYGVNNSSGTIATISNSGSITGYYGVTYRFI